MIFVGVTSGIVILVIFIMFFLCIRLSNSKKKDQRSDKERDLDDDDVGNVSSICLFWYREKNLKNIRREIKKRIVAGKKVIWRRPIAVTISQTLKPVRPNRIIQ